MRELHPKSLFLKELKSQNKLNRDFDKALLLDVDYDGYFNKVFLKFYNLKTHKIEIHLDRTNYRPYCLSNRPIKDLAKYTDINGFWQYDGFTVVKKIEPFKNKPMLYTKLFAKTPYGISYGKENIKKIIHETWESDIRFHLNYIYDNKLIVGMVYRCRDGKFISLKKKIKLPFDINEMFKDESNEFRDFAHRTINLFFQPIPVLKMLAMDIEVDNSGGAVPNTEKANRKVISISFFTPKLQVVLILLRDGMDRNRTWDERTRQPQHFFFKSEEELISKAFELIREYPILLTFAGDNFDLPYLYNRFIGFGYTGDVIPFYIKKGYGFMNKYESTLKHGIHIDLFNFFSNKSIRLYAFQARYERNSLQSVSSALLGEGKIEHEELVGDMDYDKLAAYNLKDSQLLIDLMKHSGDVVWNLMILMCRISRLPISEMLRHQISYWIKSWIINEHRAKNMLIPNKRDIISKKKGGATKAAITGKKFQGAIVIEPTAGRHYDIVVMDFAGLYPSLMNERNLSYETINCGHQECKKNKLGNLPYHSCGKRQGIVSYMVGFLKEVRVRFFKPKKDDFSQAVQQALKVYVNASWGVLGSDFFQFFCLPLAESITGTARFSIQSAIDKAEGMGIKIVYGDTDSIFLDKPSDKQVNEIEKWSKREMSLELEKEKTYRFLALSNRKKNYIGIHDDGKIEIKGLAAKKRNTPQFIKSIFEEVKEILKEITNEHEFIRVRRTLINTIKNSKKKIGNSDEYSLGDYSINIALGKDIDQYDKVVPQHVKAAIQLRDKLNRVLEQGDVISIIKTNDKIGAKPIELAKFQDIDIKKYNELLRSVLEQILDALGIHWSEIQGIKKLDSFIKKR